MKPSRHYLTRRRFVAVTFAATLSVMIIRADTHAEQATDQSAYSHPLQHLDDAALQGFAAGKAEFAARWVPPFLGGGHWGRGPQSNAQSCLECHPGNGRGRAPDNAQEEPVSLVLRLALPASAGTTGEQPSHPVYGTHLNRHGILGKLVEEGDFRVDYRYRTVLLGDGSPVDMRVPEIRITALWYGPLGKDAITSLRIAQPVFGLGLLETVSDRTLMEIAANQRRIGFNGRVNMVRDESTGAITTGRFGHKAAHPTLEQQVAAAFHEEIGVTSELFPHNECPAIQTECSKLERLSGVEARQQQLALITEYLRMLAPPARRDQDVPAVVRGAELFDKAHCAVCHVPELPVTTAGPGAAANSTMNQTVFPYTDLLLHDMGEGLADGRHEFLAGHSDWRTPPLWGLGLRRQVNGNDNLLHDGRARDLTEAILWHGGEAEVSRRAFMNMDDAQRQDLLRFLDSL